MGTRKRRYDEYRPLRAGRWGRRWRFLRTAELSVAGWGALVLACAAVGAGFVAVAAALDRPRVPAAVAGALVVVAGVVAADRRRWNRLVGVISWTDDESEVEAVAARLRERGVEVGVEAGVEVGRDRPRLVYTNRDRAAVRRALAGVGVTMPQW